MSKFEPSPFNPFSPTNLITMNYIRYDRMYNLSEFAFYGAAKDINIINVFIDMASMTRCLYRLDNVIPQPGEIAAAIINLCAHIRDYYRSRHRVNTNIYIVYGFNAPMSAIADYPEYNAHYINMTRSKHYITDAIVESTKLISTLVAYLKGIYFVQDLAPFYPEVSIIIDNLIKKVGKGYPNIIYTKDRYAYQLVAMRKMTFLFRPKKYNSEDKSFVVTKSTIYQKFREETGLKTLKDDISNLSPELFSLMLAMSGLSDRHMPSSFGNDVSSSTINNTTAISKLLNAIERRAIINGYNSTIYDVYESLRINPVLSDLFNHRYRAIDLEFQSMLYDNDPSSKIITEGLIDLYDPKGVQEVNNEFFRNYPLDLNKL